MSMSMGVPVRGCGTRVKGGIYAETLTGPNGHPIECFIKDPPIIIDPDEIGLHHVGVTLVEQPVSTYIFDWIGELYYPYVSDFIEEARRFGASRRLPATLDYSKLRGNTQLVCVHSKAVFFPERDPVDLDEWNEWKNMSASPQECPQHVKAFHDGSYVSVHQPCGSLWWTDHDAVDEDGSHLNTGEEYNRMMPSFSYVARQRPYEPPQKYQPGIFLVLPLHQIVVIRDEDSGSHHVTAGRLNGQLNGKVRVEIVDE